MLRFSRFVLISLLYIACSGTAHPLRGAPATTQATNEQWANVFDLWRTAELPRYQLLRQAVAESAIDEAAKKKAADALLDYETKLRQMVAEGRKDPARAAANVDRMRAFRKEQDPKLRNLFTPEQYEAVGRRNQGMEIQLSALSSDAQGFLEILDRGFKLTADQKSKIQPAVDRLADRVKTNATEMERAADPKDRAVKMLDGMDELIALAMAARSQIRAALTPEQLTKFDTGFRLGGDEPPEQGPPSSRPSAQPATQRGK